MVGAIQKVLTGNVCRLFCTVCVDRHLGKPVFFSNLSSAQTFSVGSLERSSATVTSSCRPSMCFMNVIEPCSWALNERPTVSDREMIRTTPSEVAKNSWSEPAHRAVTSLCFGKSEIMCAQALSILSLTEKDDCSSGSRMVTVDVSKNRNAFHFKGCQCSTTTLCAFH